MHVGYITKKTENTYASEIYRIKVENLKLTTI